MMSELKITELLERNRELGVGLIDQPVFRIRFLANIVQPQFAEIMEYALRTEGIHAVVDVGDYGAVLAESEVLDGYQAVVVFQDATMLFEESPYAFELLSDDALSGMLEHLKGQMELLFRNLSETGCALVNEFCADFLGMGAAEQSKLERVCNALNEHMRKKKPASVSMVPIGNLVAELGAGESLDRRFFYHGRSPYTYGFLRGYADFAKHLMLPLLGRRKKVLVVDCDHTLWGGVLGEDGIEGVALGEGSAAGAVYADAQRVLKRLVEQGVLLALCSKNDESLVWEMFDAHPGMILSRSDVVAWRMNWKDKAQNLRELVNELNLGLDAVVFLDDSAYECELVQRLLPKVTVWQVPSRLTVYPQMLWRNQLWFHDPQQAVDAGSKTRQYHEERRRGEHATAFSCVEDYLMSLELRMSIGDCQDEQLERAAQLTQKTNQFNMMTRRCSGAELQQWQSENGRRLLLFSASDRFGDYGVCGLCMLHVDGDNVCVVDNFLMSCRVFGRHLEQAFMAWLVEQEGCEKFVVRYRRTERNGMCEDFLAGSGFVRDADDAERFCLVRRDDLTSPACVRIDDDR